MSFHAQSRLLALHRRQFLKSAGLGAAALALPQVAFAADTAATLIPGKDSRLIVHTANPLLFETPLDLLAREQLTPAAQLFVRNVQHSPELASLKPGKLSGWKLEVGGLIKEPHAFDGAQLQDIPWNEVEMVLQCSGNSRVLFARAAKVKGTPWDRGAVGNVRFAGVPLRLLVDKFGIEIKPQAKFLTAEGIDEPPPNEHDFEHSIPLEDALDRAILAIELNGKPLPAIHGGPLRLIVPGYYGTMHVKWLHRLRFEDSESDHTSQIPNYRTPREPIEPGAPFVPTYANSEPNWRMKIKSIVLAPADGAQVPAGQTHVRGVAFNDGSAKIDQVLTSIDGGRSWQQANVETPESPYAWYRWTAKLKLPQGKHEIWARAVDALGRTQPLDGAIHWNPQGYAWNGVEKIAVTAS